MGVLDIAALVVIFFLVILLTAAIVALGSLPGKIARKRNHPYADAINVASWVGLALGIFWPIAFIWAFLPVKGTRGDLAEMNKRLSSLEKEIEQVRSQRTETAS
jgi:uncharacterized protein DUF3302